MADRAKHAFGNLSDVQSALNAGKIDAYDILFLDGDTEPKVGWIDKNGVFRLVENGGDTTELEGQVTELETELATKANAAEVNAKIDEAVAGTMSATKAYTDEKVEAAISEYMVKKYEITSVPDGVLIDYRDKEIRVMCPADTQWVKQNVGTGGDPNAYYMTLKTYVPNDDVVGYIEHLGNQVDSEILTSFSVDEHGHRYQSTWLALAKYDETADTWSYYGKNSSKEKFVGWDYQIDWYNANGAIIASDSVRINLSNENCHSSIEPYYIGSMMKEVETMMEEKVAEVNSAYEVIEF